MKIDFHVHTRHSLDSLIKPDELARKSMRLGVIPAIADHNLISAHKEMRATGALFIPAEEIFTGSGDLIGLYLNELIPRGTQFSEAIDKVHQQGGLAYIPHMFDYGRSGRHASEAEAAKVDIVEAFNARCMDQEFNRKAADFAARKGITKGAGSDSHFLFEFGSTYVELPSLMADELEDPKTLLRALRSKDAGFVTKRTRIYARGTTKVISAARRMLRKLGGA